MGYQKLVGGAVKGKGLRRRRVLDTGGAQITLELDFPKLLELYHAQKGECFYCGARMTLQNGVTRDHFFAKSISWRNRSLLGNAVLACQRCNNEEKGNRLPSDSEFERFLSLYNAVVVAGSYKESK
jgi:5-methylcytosine-specific restriction endonuclease McrA